MRFKEPTEETVTEEAVTETPVEEPTAEETVEETVANEPVEEIPEEVIETPVVEPVTETAAEETTSEAVVTEIPTAEPAMTEAVIGTPVAEPTPAPTEEPTPEPTAEPEEAERADLVKIREYVERCYTVILGRKGEEAGVNNWVNQLSSGAMGGAAVVRGFVASDEFIAKKYSPKQVVTILYNAMLGRDPDPAGLNDWIEHMEVGMTSDAIVAGFTGSQEFGNICNQYGILPGNFTPTEWRDRNHGVTAFVFRAYKLILNRAAEPAGQNNWCAELLSGRMAGADIVMQFLGSQEFLNRYIPSDELVDILYNTMLGRGADAAGKADWLGKLMNGQEASAIVNGFSGSQEFMGICRQYGINPGTINVATAPHVHTWEQTVVTLATCTVEGVSRYLCHVASCGASETVKTPAAGHKSQPIADVPSTCTVAGHTGGTECSVCHAVITPATEVPAMGHSWQPSPDGDPTKQVCSVCQASGVVDASNYRALLIGNGTYDNPKLDLVSPSWDLRRMNTMLNNINDGGYIGNIVSKKNVTDSELQSLINNNLVSGADSNTVSVFYYSGHGFEASGGSSGGIATPDGYGITYTTLAYWLNDVPGKVIVILDCCYSGDSVYARGSFDPNRAAIAAFSAVDGGIVSRSGDLRTSKFVVLTACTQDQQSWAMDSFEDDEKTKLEDSYGIFTRRLCDKIGTSGPMEADDNEDGIVTLAEIFVHTQGLYVIDKNKNIVHQDVMCYPSGSNYPIAYRTEDQ